MESPKEPLKIILTATVAVITSSSFPAHAKPQGIDVHEKLAVIKSAFESGAIAIEDRFGVLSRSPGAGLNQFRDPASMSQFRDPASPFSDWHKPPSGLR